MRHRHHSDKLGKASSHQGIDCEVTVAGGGTSDMVFSDQDRSDRMKQSVATIRHRHCFSRSDTA